MDDAEETLEDEEPDEEGEESEEVTSGQAPATPTPVAGDEEVESIQEILVKQEARSEEAEAEEEDSVLNLSREEKLEPLAVKVVPPQASEFICSNCYLVKHRSQLKDKAKMLCRDCA